MQRRPIRLGMIVPDIQDPTSYYRGAGPLSVLQKQLPELEFLFPNPVNWGTLKLCDILFMQRPALPDHFNALVMAKDNGIPVWVDFDDDNLAVTKDNPTYHMYSQPPIKDAIVKLTRYADAVTVSTEKLRKKYSIYNKNVFVIPNALDDFALRLRNIPSSPREKLITWRGTPTHYRNLKVIQHEVIKLMTNYPSWKFGFLGHEPLAITEGVLKEFKPVDFDNAPSDPAELAKWANEKLREWRQKENDAVPHKNAVIFNNGVGLPLQEYYKAVVQTHATAYYYPLAKNDHSQARSHVSWIEATFGSSLFIGPDHEEFKRPGTLNFKTPEEFYSIVESVIKGEVDVSKHVEESWACIQDKYMLSKINNIRAELLVQLHQRVYGPALPDQPAPQPAPAFSEATCA